MGKVSFIGLMPLLVILAACQMPAPTGDIQSAEVISEGSQAEIIPAEQAAVGPNASPPSISSPTVLPAKETPQASLSSSKANEFIGLNKKRLALLLGQPQRVRRDPGMEVWQYVSASCMLEFYLYSQQNGDFQVTYLESRDRLAAAPMENGSCLNSLAITQHS